MIWWMRPHSVLWEEPTNAVVLVTLITWSFLDDFQNFLKVLLVELSVQGFSQIQKLLLDGVGGCCQTLFVSVQLSLQAALWLTPHTEWLSAQFARTPAKKVPLASILTRIKTLFDFHPQTNYPLPLGSGVLSTRGAEQLTKWNCRSPHNDQAVAGWPKQRHTDDNLSELKDTSRELH